MKKKFWTLDRVDSATDKQNYEVILKQLKRKCIIYSRCLLLDCLVCIWADTVVNRGFEVERFPFQMYFPEFIPLGLVLAINTVMAELAMLSMVTVDVLVFTTAGLVQLQFKILNTKLRSTFTNVHARSCRHTFIDCNEHLTHLLK